MRTLRLTLATVAPTNGGEMEAAIEVAWADRAQRQGVDSRALTLQSTARLQPHRKAAAIICLALKANPRLAAV